MTAQEYVDQALAAGLSQSTIDSFIQYNPNDYGRIWSAFNLGSSGSSSGYQSTTTAYIPPAPGGSMADSNPAATLYAATVAVATAQAAGSMPVASDEVLTITGQLGGMMPERTAEIPGMPGVVASTTRRGSIGGFDTMGLLKLAAIVVVAVWIFRGAKNG